MDISLALLAMFMGLPGVLATILMLAFVFWMWSPRPARAEEKAPAPVPTAGITTNAIKSLTRVEIQQKLRKLAETPAPEKEGWASSCYARTAPPSRAEYVCPKCGEKTLYIYKKPDGLHANQPPIENLACTVLLNIPSARRQIPELQKMAGWSVVLDESQFCRKCSPGVKNPKFFFKMEYICQKCGDKTLYTDQAAQVGGWPLQNVGGAIRELQKVAGEDVALDASQLCRKCSPAVKDPKFALKLGYADGNPQTVVGVSPDDLTLLIEFFSGKLTHEQGDRWSGSKKPLKDFSLRLQQLLGVEVK